MYRVTADSNIYKSAIVFGGKPLTLLDMALERQIELAISDALLSETLRICATSFIAHRDSSKTPTDSSKASRGTCIRPNVSMRCPRTVTTTTCWSAP